MQYRAKTLYPILSTTAATARLWLPVLGERETTGEGFVLWAVPGNHPLFCLWMLQLQVTPNMERKTCKSLLQQAQESGSICYDKDLDQPHFQLSCVCLGCKYPHIPSFIRISLEILQKSFHRDSKGFTGDCGISFVLTESFFGVSFDIVSVIYL